jgi:predicted transcriptional regulator
LSDWKEALVKSNQSVRAVLEVINIDAVQIALVVDESMKLFGTVTDGDIRRSILKAVSLDCLVSQIMIHDSSTVPEDYSSEQLTITVE